MSDEKFAAERRADYVRALREERDMCDRGGKSDRVKAIDAELERVGEKPIQRTAPQQQTAAQDGARRGRPRKGTEAKPASADGDAS